MMRRCEQPDLADYLNYGARGIGVHEPWCTDPRSFLEWLDANLGPCPPGRSLDRIDNDGDYEPGNLPWADKTMQARNRRKGLPRR